MARWYLGRRPFYNHTSKFNPTGISAPSVCWCPTICPSYWTNKQKKTLILYANRTKRSLSAFVSSAENTVHTHPAPKREEIHTLYNSAVRRVRRPRARGPTPTRANLTTRSNPNSLIAWLTSSHRLNEQPRSLRRQRLYTIQNQVSWFIISINTINIQKYVNNKTLRKYSYS